MMGFRIFLAAVLSFFAMPVMAKAQLTEEEMSSVRNQVAKCWNIPLSLKDAKNNKDYTVTVILNYNQDGHLKSAEITDMARYASDPIFNAEADAVLVALHDPKCDPLNWPADKYDVWSKVKIDFNPRIRELPR